MAVDDRQILTDRVRTIDQIKRLYAVVMGYALTSCFSNVYACVKAVGPDFMTVSMLFAQAITFTSLIALLYLGTERLLDTRYLHPNSRVPSRFRLFCDLANLGIMAAWFVVLADTFPDTSKPVTIEVLRGSQVQFTQNLLVLYLIDVVTLVYQTGTLYIDHPADKTKALHAHLRWIAQNVACFGFFAIVYRVWAGWDLALLGATVNALAAALAIIHVGRFFADFWLNYPFYYPTDELSGNESAPQLT